ncbi:MAG: metallophosphoesterase [Desulfobaccales bacterium]
MDIKLPRILSPNLGCPIIISSQDLMRDGIDVVIAEPIDAARSVYSIVAKPSFGGGQEFALVQEAQHELTDPGLPRTFERVEQTRWHISTTLRASIFAGKARFVRFSARPSAELTEEQQRTITGGPRITLYNLVLKQGAEEIFKVFHALALRPAEGMLRFIHATDLHVALRNDLYDATSKIGKDANASSPIPFVNFNKNLRRFIQYANDLADDGKLDFVLLLGDLVDFKEHNYSDRDDYGENNWKLLCDILTGAEAKGGRGGKTPAIKVPVFTSTGNHDWRFFPYPPADNAAAYGLDKKSSKALDPFWADDPEELTQATKEFYQKMIGEGALLSNVMLGGKFLHDVGEWVPKLRDKLRGLVFRDGKVRGNPLDWFLPRMATWKVQVLAPLASGIATSAKLPTKWVGVVIVGVSGLINWVIGLVKWLVRWKSPDLMALEAGWPALRDYFLNLNPYFNYAFRVDKNYFLILDTGFDCIRTQRFWDDGRKKLGPIGIKTGTLGGSPDSMGFFGANEFYPYSQIVWMEGLLRLIRHGESIADGPARVFIGVHAPPINLSKKQRLKADSALQGQQEIPLEPGKYNIRYGSINHYLSQFLHLCLGRAEGRPEDRYRPVTMVLAGHAHWRLECCLHWDPQMKQPSVYYGDYTCNPRAWQDCLDKSRPLILQTPAIGPIGDDPIFKSPPHFRWIEVDKIGTVLHAEVTSI